MSKDEAEATYARALELSKASDPILGEIEDLLRRAAALGSGEANFALGSWYFFGKHFEKSVENAIKYWEIAAIQGNVDACLELAKIYERGDLVEKNREKILCNYLMAVAQGSGQAFFELARSFYHGIFTPESQAAYEKLMERAEEIGFEDRT